MTEQADRAAEFRAEVAQMGLRDPVTKREQVLLRLGAVGLGAGPVVAIIAYLLSHNTLNPLQQRDALVIAVIGLCITVVGGVLFVRYSLGRMLRFWLARFAFEQHVRARGSMVTEPAGKAVAPADGGDSAVADTATASRQAPDRPLKAH